MAQVHYPLRRELPRVVGVDTIATAMLGLNVAALERFKVSTYLFGLFGFPAMTPTKFIAIVLHSQSSVRVR
ncbi:MAG: hypothetical protein AAF384_15160 [Pseudomonadota bacterium]